MGMVLIILYLFSGVASIAYEILWTRMLSLQFGVSIFGVVATVTAFMMGLGLGSLAGSRWLTRIASPLRVFAVLEMAVAIFAFVMPQLFHVYSDGLSQLAPMMAYGEWMGLQFVSVVIALMLPALAMGAGFPMVLAAIEKTSVGLAGLYGMNALGGAVGALLPLALLPLLGWLAATQLVASLGFFVGVTALLLSYRYKFKVGIVDNAAGLRVPPVRWLLLYAGIGAAALILEISWTRFFGMILLRTEYVLAIILAVFLIGIGAGSLLARHLFHALWFSLLPVIAATFAIMSLLLLSPVSAWVEAEKFSSLANALVSQGIAIAVLTLPVTLVLGAWLPLLSKRLDAGDHSGAWLYGANSLGAGLGSLLAGFVLIPALGSSATIVLAAIMLLVLGLSWAPHRQAWMGLVVLLLMAIPAWQMPAVATLMPKAHANASDIYIYEDAVSITHVVEQANGQRQLLADLHRMDASSEPTAVAVQKNQAILPLLLHPEPRSVLFLGLGTAISAAGSLPFPGLERTAVELSRGAINAARDYFAVVNDGVMERMEVVRDDARHYLLSSNKHYDVIIGDLFHPDLVGRSALLSVQQFQRVQRHLAPGGIYVQWLALNQFDIRNLKVVLRTFRKVFPDAVIFADAFRLALVGPQGMTVSMDRVLHNLSRMEQTQANLATGGEGPWTWLGRYWGRIPYSKGPVQDEWAPVIEYQLPGARYSGELDLAKLLDWLLRQRPRVEVAAQELAVSAAEGEAFERGYVATELALRSWLALLTGNDREGQRLLPLAYQANPQDRWIGFAVADGLLADTAAAKARGLSDEDLFKTVLRIRPDHVEALRGLWELARQRGAAAEAAKYEAELRRLSPLDAGLRGRQSAGS